MGGGFGVVWGGKEWMDVRIVVELLFDVFDMGYGCDGCGFVKY